MSIQSYYQIPEKVRVVNSTTKTPITFRDATNAAVAAAGATVLSVEGFGRFGVTELKSATLSRGLTPTLETWSITAATAGEITVVAPSSPTRVWVKILLESVGRDFATARNQYEFGRTIEIEVTANVGETAGTLAAKIYNALFLDTAALTNKSLFIKSGANTAGTFVNGVATTLTELELQCTDRNYTIRSFTVTGDNFLASTVLTVFNPTNTVVFNRGKNYGFDIEMHEKRTTFNNWPYGWDNDEIPVADQLYTSVTFEFESARLQKQDSNLSNRTRYVLFLNQTNCESIIQSLGDFFGQLSNEVYNGIVATVYTPSITLAQFKTNA